MLALFFAQTTAAPTTSPGGSLFTYVPLLFMLVIMYVIMIRPQQRRQKEQQRMIGAVKTGDKIVTSAGIHGLVANVKDSTVIVKVADNVKIEMEKSAIATVVKEG